MPIVIVCFRRERKNLSFVCFIIKVGSPIFCIYIFLSFHKNIIKLICTFCSVTCLFFWFMFSVLFISSTSLSKSSLFYYKKNSSVFKTASSLITAGVLKLIPFYCVHPDQCSRAIVQLLNSQRQALLYFPNF